MDLLIAATAVRHGFWLEAKVSALAEHEAVLPTTKPHPAVNPHQCPSRSRP